VLSKQQHQPQAAAVVGFCELISSVHKAKNYTVLHAIVKGLNKVSVQRLAAVWKGIPAKSIKNLQSAESLLSPANNFALYKKEYARGVSKKKKPLPCLDILLHEFRKVSAPNRQQTMDAAKKACPSASSRGDAGLEAVVSNLPFISDDTLLLLSLDCYSPEYKSDETISTYSLVFSYDRLTPSDITESTNSSWDDGSATRTIRTHVRRHSSSPRKQDSNTLSLPGRYGQPRASDDAKNRVGTINKYGYTLACHFSELQAEKGIKVKVSRKTLALFLHNGQVFAMKDRCPHQNVPLHRKCIAHTSHTLSSDVNVNSC